MYFFKSALPFLVFLASTESCFLQDVDYKGNDMNNGLESKTDSAMDCQKYCVATSGCDNWTWVSSGFSDPAYHNTCWLKRGNPNVVASKGSVSGPRDCGSQGSCCQDLDLDSSGMGDFYQGNRLGRYSKHTQMANGRWVYKQSQGDNYLFWLADQKIWMVGTKVGQDIGGILYRGSPICPEEATNDWEYWSDWQDKWVEDWTLKAKCNDDNGGDDDEPCTSGSACDDCNIWAAVNGVKYCCAQDCNYGSVDVSTENGHVVCKCNH